MDLCLLILPNDKRVDVELIFQAAVTDLNVPTRIPLLLFKLYIKNIIWTKTNYFSTNSKSTME